MSFYKDLSPKEIIDIFPRKVQSQCIEDQNDGFPIENNKYLGDLDELIAVALDIKPCAVISYHLIKKLYDKNYTKEQIIGILKILNKDIYYIPSFIDDKGILKTILIFTKKYKDYALIEYYGSNIGIWNKSDLKLKLDHIIRGITFRYNKNDIIAWFLTGDLAKHYNFNGLYYKKRNKIISMKDSHEVKDKLYNVYEKNYNKSQLLLPKLINKSKKLEEKYKYVENNIKKITI